MRRAEIIKKSNDTDGVIVRIMEDTRQVYQTEIPGTQWVIRKNNNDYQISSPDVSYTLTAEDIEKIDKII